MKVSNTNEFSGKQVAQLSQRGRATHYFDWQNCEVEFLRHPFRGLRGT